MYPRPIPPAKKRRHHPKRVIFCAALLLIAVAYGGLTTIRPLALLQPITASSSIAITTPSADLPWPSYGQGAFGLVDGKVIATHGEQTPMPIASATKLVTALVVLQKYPLAPEQDGPTITFGDHDVALYEQYVAAEGSVVPVYSGQQFTERQMLEAMMLPSANNIADSLATWAFGSMDSYLKAASTFATSQGLSQTHLGGDASGFSPLSTSTAENLVKIGALAEQNPSLAAIVAEKAASLPGIGVVHNVDTLLGTNTIVGIKTGNNDQNGGVFVGAATQDVHGKSVTVITALSGGPNLGTVLQDSTGLLATIKTTFAKTTIVHAGTVLGGYRDTKGHLLQAVAGSDLNLLVLRGASVTGTINLHAISNSATSGQTVGSVRLSASAYAPTAQVPIILKQTPSKPSVIYRLTHP